MPTPTTDSSSTTPEPARKIAELPETITLSRRHYLIMFACTLQAVEVLKDSVMDAAELSLQIRKYTAPFEFKEIMEQMTGIVGDADLDLSQDMPQSVIDRNGGQRNG